LKPNSHRKCISACEGNFSAATAQMCGRDQGVITKTILEMVTTVLNSAFSLADNIIKMKEDGVDGETLANTIQVFIDLGKPFANPACPSRDEAPQVHICRRACDAGDAPGECRRESEDGLVSCAPRAADGACASDATTCDLLSKEGSRRRGRRESLACKTGEVVYLTSHRGHQLQDNNGHVGFSPNRRSWERWTLSDAGDGSYFVTSHRGQQLSDQHGRVAFSPLKDAWEAWRATDAGDGKVFLTSHRHQQLQDNNGQASLSWHALRWEEWILSDVSLNAACSTTSTTTQNS